MGRKVLEFADSVNLNCNQAGFKSPATHILIFYRVVQLLINFLKPFFMLENETFSSSSDNADDLKRDLNRGASNVKSDLRDTADDLRDDSKDLADDLEDDADHAGHKIKHASHKVADGTEDVADDFKDKAKNVWENIKDKAEDLGDKIKNKFD